MEAAILGIRLSSSSPTIPRMLTFSVFAVQAHVLGTEFGDESGIQTVPERSEQGLIFGKMLGGDGAGLSQSNGVRYILSAGTAVLLLSCAVKVGIDHW